MRARSAAAAIAATSLLAGACSAGSDHPAATRPTTSASSGASSDNAAAATSATGPLPQAVQELEVTATEYSFEISPDPSGGLKPGWTLLKFHNVGAEAHQVMFARIKDGVDMSELAAAGAGDSSGAGAIEFVDMIGGVSYIGPDQDTTALVDLSEGLVMAMCYVPDAKGVAHALMGMTTALTVKAPATGADTAPSAEPPTPTQTVGTIELAEGRHRLPRKATAGWYHVTNTDTVLHELALLRLDEAVDDDEAAGLVEDLAANKAPRVEVEAVGGMGAISPGFDGYLHLDLDAGHYLAVDFMPDPGKPRPHMLDGYYRAFDA